MIEDAFSATNTTELSNQTVCGGVAFWVIQAPAYNEEESMNKKDSLRRL